VFAYIDLEQLSSGWLQGISFCKKRVWLESTETHFRLQSEPSIPIPECLSNNANLSFVEQAKAWRNLHLGLRRYELDQPQNAIYADTLRALFLRKYPSCFPPTVYKTLRVLKPMALWETVDGRCLTKEAYALVLSYADIVTEEGEYLNTFRDRLFHSLSLGHNLIYDVLIGNENMELVVRKNQQLPFQVTLTKANVGVSPDYSLLSILEKL
jgi:hypothetical protein